MSASETLAAILPHLPLQARVLVALALGEASEGELVRRARTDRRSLRRVLERLTQQGLVVEEAGRYRIAPDPKQASREKAPSPLEALARGEGAHVTSLLRGLARHLPQEAQPLAAKAPKALLRACEAAMIYPAGGRLGKLVAWVREVRAWVREVGEEAVCAALEQAARHARDPFPYAEKIVERLKERLEKPQNPEDVVLL